MDVTEIHVAVLISWGRVVVMPFPPTAFGYGLWEGGVK